MTSEANRRATTGEMLVLAAGVKDLLDSARWAIDHRDAFQPPVQQVVQMMREDIATEFLRQTPVGAVMWGGGHADSPHPSSGAADGETSPTERTLNTPGRAVSPAEDKHSTAGHEATPVDGMRTLSSVGDLLFPPQDPQQAGVEPPSTAPQALERAEALYRLAVASARFNPGRTTLAHPLESTLVLALSEFNRIDDLLDMLAKAYHEIPSVTPELVATVEQGCRRRFGPAMASRRTLQTAYDALCEISRSTAFDTMQQNLAQLYAQSPVDGLSAEHNHQAHRLKFRGALETVAPGFTGAETGVSDALHSYVELASLMHDAETVLGRDVAYYEKVAKQEIDAIIREESLRYLENVSLGVLAELDNDLRECIPNDQHLSVAQVLRAREMDLELQLHVDFDKVHAIKQEARRFNILTQQCVRISLSELARNGRANTLIVSLGQLLYMDADPELPKRLQGNYSSVRFKLLPLREGLFGISRYKSLSRTIPKPIEGNLNDLRNSKQVNNLQDEVALAHRIDSLDTAKALTKFAKSTREYTARLKVLVPGIMGSWTGIQGTIRDYVDSLDIVTNAQRLIDEGSHYRKAIATKVQQLGTSAIVEFVQSCPVDMLRYEVAYTGVSNFRVTGRGDSSPTIGDALGSTSHAQSHSMGMPQRMTIRRRASSLVRNASSVAKVELSTSGDMGRMGDLVLSLRRYLCIETPLTHLVHTHNGAHAALSGASKALASAKEKGTSTTDALKQTRRPLKAAKAIIKKLQTAATTYQQAADNGNRATVSSAWRAFQKDPDPYRRALLDTLPCAATDARGIPLVLKDYVNAATLVADVQRGLDSDTSGRLTTEADVQRKLDTTSVDELAYSVQPQRLKYLKTAGYWTVSDILHASQNQLMQVRGIGQVTASSIKSSALAFGRQLRNGTRLEPELIRLGNNSSRARQARTGLVSRIAGAKQHQAILHACDAADLSLKRVSHLLTQDHGSDFMTKEEVQEIENTLAKLQGPDGPVTELLDLMDAALRAAGDVYLREP